MGGKFPEQPKIVRGPHQPFAEMPPPDPIHKHATGQRVLRVHEPLGHFHSSALMRIELRLNLFGQYPGHTTRNNLTQLQGIPTNMNGDIDDRFLRNPHGTGEFKNRFFQLCQLFTQSFQLVLHPVWIFRFSLGRFGFTLGKRCFQHLICFVDHRLNDSLFLT